MWDALRRCRVEIVTVAATYALAVVVGAAMVHAGNDLALGTRDSLVERAHATDRASIALAEGRRVEAALIDFGQNVALAAVPITVAGLAVVLPYPFIAYRGWVGGIVSVDSDHRSRLVDPPEAVYYLVTLILQLVPAALTGGAGVALGLAYLRRRPGEPRVVGLPRRAVLDVVTIYAVSLPIFVAASLWEFLAR
jgi:hypothetical protein